MSEYERQHLERLKKIGLEKLERYEKALQIITGDKELYEIDTGLKGFTASGKLDLIKIMKKKKEKGE